jgi:DNA polymerase III subunit epsilon
MMAFEPFYHFMRGIQGKVFGGAQVQNAQQIAQMRQLQRELNSEDSLKVPLSKLPVVVFDLETTGFFPDQGDEIISIGAIKVVGSCIQEDEAFYSLVHYEKTLPENIEQLTGISGHQLGDAPPLSEVLVRFFKFVKDDALVAHHANHERNFLQHASRKLFRTPFIHRIVDTSYLFRVSEPSLKITRLEDYCQHNDIQVVNRHHALGDAKLTAKLWCIYINNLQDAGCKTLKDVYERMARL